MNTFQTITQWIEKQIDLEERREKILLKEFHHDRSQMKRTVTYQQIRSMANEICEYLTKTLKLHQRMIIISANETIFSIPMILGILQSGNAFFICDFHWPKSLIKMYLDQLQASLLICLHDEEKINIDEQIFISSQHSSIVQLDQLIHFYSFSREYHYEQIAYAVASSGSTGIPKLIFVSHQCILPNLIQLEFLFDVTSNDCLLRSTPLTFDPALIDIFVSLHAGASIVIFSKEIRQNPMKFSSIFEQSQCTIAQMTPSFFRQVETSWNLKSLKTLILGGEPFPNLSNSTITHLIRNGKRVINIYGLTEMSCWASYYILSEKDLDRTTGIPLGHSLDETSLLFEPFHADPIQNNCYQLIIESHTRWTRLGNLTNERQFRFQTDDLIAIDRERDEIFYLGRKTLTKKRLGIMINFEYIEKIAHQSNLLDECACFMSTEDENVLILLCKFKVNAQIDQLNRFLQTQLSEHFLPNRIVSLQKSLPLTTNGKIDRNQLFSLYLQTRGNASQQSLHDVWQDLLNQIPQNDSNFISQGGNSLMALTCLERIKHSSPMIDQNYLFDLILHQNFEHILQYLNDPQREPISAETISSSNKPMILSSTDTSNQTLIWSIQRCNQIFLHNDHNLMTRQTSVPGSISMSTAQLKFHWKSSMKKCIDGSPVIVVLDEIRQYVIVGSHAGLIHAYQIETGSLIWSFETNDRIEASGTLSRDGKYFLIGDYSGMLYMINVSDGTFYSSYQCQGLIKSVACIHPRFDIIYLGAHDQYVHAIQIQETLSHSIWKYGLKSSCVSSPQLSTDTHHLFVATLSGDVFAFQSIDGHVRWKISLNKPIFSTMTLWKDEYLIIGCVDQNLYCFTCETGKQRWNFITEGPIFSSPSLFNNDLFIGCHDRYLYALDLITTQPNRLKWKCLFPSMIYGSPFIHNDGQWIVVGSTNGCLRVLDTYTGAVLSEILVDGQGLFSSPICYRDLIFVGSRDDHLYCYQL